MMYMSKLLQPRIISRNSRLKAEGFHFMESVFQPLLESMNSGMMPIADTPIAAPWPHMLPSPKLILVGPSSLNFK